jgi:hypothetical protein
MKFLAVMTAVTLWAGAAGGQAEYVGGTSAIFAEKTGGRLVTAGSEALRFESKSKSVEIPYDRIHTIEYGQQVNRRYVSALLISPLLLLAKARKHFVTVGYNDGEGRAQALIFRVAKADVRVVLVGLEARTGRKVAYQDDEARKAGKG